MLRSRYRDQKIKSMNRVILSASGAMIQEPNKILTLDQINAGLNLEWPQGGELEKINQPFPLTLRSTNLVIIMCSLPLNLKIN